MKIYGYKKGCENLIELEEVTISAEINELKKLLNFIEIEIEKIANVTQYYPICHSHFRDFDDKWSSNQPDIIIATISDNK